MESNGYINDPTEHQKAKWKSEQRTLKAKLITTDQLDFDSDVTEIGTGNPNALRYVGGVDISFVPDNDEDACAALVVLDMADDMLTLPFISGFLGFREVPHLKMLLEELKEQRPEVYPQVLMVDGNGVLHHRGFGAASHLGVEMNIPTIGVGKTLLHHDGLSEKVARQRVKEQCAAGDYINLVGKSSNQVHGVALRCTPDSVRPIYVSIGHRISLETAVNIVKSTVRYRIPEPVRQADLQSRAYIAKRMETEKEKNNAEENEQ